MSENRRWSIDLEEAYEIIIKSNLVIFKWTLSEEVPTDFVSENIDMFGYTPEDFYTGPLKDYWDFVHPEDRARVKGQLYYARAHGSDSYKNQYRVLCKNGDIKWVEEWVIHERDPEGRLIHERGILHEITEMKRAEERIQFLSEHDPLTGLWNRLYYDARIAELEKNGESGVGVIIGDINGLKMVNDAYGHKVGDQMLVATAEVLKQIFQRPDDVIARLSGDEFAIITKSRNVAHLMDKIYVACRNLTQFPFEVNLSLGYAVRKKASVSMDSVFREADYAMYRHKLNRSRKIKRDMITALKRQLELKSIETANHSSRMVEMAEKVGKYMMLNTSLMEELLMAVEMHDIGMVSIDNQLLDKPTRLTEAELKEIRKHTEIGYHLLVASPNMAGIAEYVLSHHENYDGTGYPQGLKESEIPMLSRLISVIDSYEAMTHRRPYREALTHEQALEELMSLAGSKYDPEIVKSFINAMKTN